MPQVPAGFHRHPFSSCFRRPTAVMLCRSLLVMLMLDGLALCGLADELPLRSTGKTFDLQRFQQFIELRCVSCHDRANNKGGLSLDDSINAEFARDSGVWEKVVRK